ncbi:hypothetical protein KEM55_004910 [Ascosphaera atra]|nr:hypothetical protein KEM55_004910 [Ascosphaera atra]
MNIHSMSETYVLYGFRWARGQQPESLGIRAYVVFHDILDAASEYLQEPTTHQAVLESFEKFDPEILSKLPDLRLIEQYDPDDTSGAAVSQPHAYVAARSMVMGDRSKKGGGLGLDIGELMEVGPGLEESAMEALHKLRDELAPGSKIGWFVVYNGDPERSTGESSDTDGDSYYTERRPSKMSSKSKEKEKEKEKKEEKEAVKTQALPVGRPDLRVVSRKRLMRWLS